MRRRAPVFVALACLCLAGCGGPPRPPVASVAPPATAVREACALIVTDDDIPSGSAVAGALYVPDADMGRALLTADVVAAAEGFLAGGLTCVEVVDSHDGAIDPAPLAAIGVPLLTPSNTEGWTWPFLGPMRRRYVVAALMGFHDNAGAGGLRPHTVNDAVRRLTIDGREVGEVAHLVHGLASFGVPVGLVSGTERATAEADALVPGVERVAVRWQTADGAVEFLASADAHTRLRAAARRAALAPPPVLAVQGPLSVRLDVHAAGRLADRGPELASGWRAVLAELGGRLAAVGAGPAGADPALFDGARIVGRTLAWEAPDGRALFLGVGFAAWFVRGAGDGFRDVSEGYQAYREGRWADALAAYDRALAVDPHDIGTLCRRGAAHEGRGDREQAYRDFADGFARLDEVGDAALAGWCAAGLAPLALARGEVLLARRAALEVLALPDRGERHAAARALLERSDRGRPVGGDDAGVEGLFPWEAFTAELAQRRGLRVDAERLRAWLPRLGKLVLPLGEAERPRAEWEAEETFYCAAPRAAVFNRIMCRGLQARTCDGDTCRGPTFGSCSGVFVAPGRFLTAGHCVTALQASAELQAAARVVRFRWSERGWEEEAAFPVRGIVSLKRSWADGWVIRQPDPTDRMDVALIRLDEPEGAYPAVAPSSVPPAGEPVVVLGFPRARDRREADRAAAGYDLVPGAASVSFGRVIDPNREDAPLCSPTGRQDDWTLREPCPTGAGADEEGAPVATGLITEGPFLSNADTMNGYSGAPVFDAAGRWIGLTVTVFGADPRPAWSPALRIVHLKGDALRQAFEAAGHPL